RNGKEIFADGKFFPDLMVEEAGKFMTENKDKPFFIYFAMNMPHYPYQGEPQWLKRYDKLEYPRNLYAAFLSTLDERIGKLLAQVDKLGLRENTIIVYQSDHGHSTELRAHNGGGNAGPYRGAKFSMFEGGLRVPAMIRWPGRLPAGEVRDQAAHGCDWLPTVAELCNIKVEHDIDGRSLVPVIKSAKAPTPHKVIHWQTGTGDKSHWAVRQGDWKLLGNPQDTSDKAPLGPGDRLFLVNLAEDVSEMKNLAAQHPERVKELQKLHDDWVKSVSK
ncbi:MAG: sulfatase, partial [Gemmataceae bacterium]